MFVQLYHCAKAMLAADMHCFVMLDVGCPVFLITFGFSFGL